MSEQYESQQWYANTEEEDSGSGATSTISGRTDAMKGHEELIKDDPTNLIVNYLPVYFDKNDLRAMFEPYGKIESLIVMYNNRGQRKKSRGYGFVKFSNAKEAQAAIEGVDGTRFQHKTIKVSVARPGRARKCSNLFVSRLPIDWETPDLEKVFKPFGHIVECRVLKFTDGVSRRCGFVRFDKDDEAQQALRKLRDFRPSPDAQPFQVNLSVNHSPDVRRKYFDSHDYHEMNMHGLGSSFDREFPPFSDYGPSRYGGYDDHHYDDFGYGPPMQRPYHHYPPRPQYRNDYGRPYYNGFREQKWHTYEEPTQPSKQHTPPHQQPAPTPNPAPAPAPVPATVATPTEETQQQGDTAPPTAVAEKTRIFVKNLPEFYDESNLKSLFSSYGEVAEVTVQRDRNGKSMQCAFIVFKSSDSAKKAVDALDGVFLCSARIQINFV
jgi:RNA recognition motif-containing protein